MLLLTVEYKRASSLFGDSEQRQRRRSMRFFKKLRIRLNIIVTIIALIIIVMIITHGDP